MAKFTVNLGINDLQRTLRVFKAYDAETQARLRYTVQSSTTAIMLGAKRRAPVKSGDLVKNITMAYDGARNIGIIRAKSPHAHLVEYGHKGAVIKPENKKALVTPFGPKEEVRTPPVPEHPFMRPAFEDEKPNLLRSAEAAMQP